MTWIALTLFLFFIFLGGIKKETCRFGILHILHLFNLVIMCCEVELEWGWEGSVDTHQLLWGIARGLGGTTGVITVVKCKMFDFLPTVSVIRRLIHLHSREKGFITYWERHVYFHFYSNIYHAFKLNIQVLNLYIHICRISFLFWGALMNNTNIENIDKWIVKVQKLSSVWWYPSQTKCCFKMACSYIYAD